MLSRACNTLFIYKINYLKFAGRFSRRDPSARREVDGSPRVGREPLAKQKMRVKCKSGCPSPVTPALWRRWKFEVEQDRDRGSAKNPSLTLT